MSIRDNAGFSYIEILLGISILSIALMPILNYFISSLSTVNQSAINNQALDLVGNTIEVIKARSKLDWNYLDTVETSFNSSELSPGRELATQDYNLQIMLTDSIDLDSDGISDYKFLIVEVWWDNNQEKVSLNTLISRR